MTSRFDLYRVPLASLVAAVAVASWAAPAQADYLAFSWEVSADAPCSAAWTRLTTRKGLEELVPHLNPKADFESVTKFGDILHVSRELPDGAVARGQIMATVVEPPARLHVIVRPDNGPWIRVQEFEFEDQKTAKTESPDALEATDSCQLTYRETYNPVTLKAIGVKDASVVKKLREPYMRIIMRRLRNLAEGKPAGPPDEVAELRSATGPIP